MAALDLARINRRLGQLILMLSSEHDGEVVTAARAIDRLLKSEQADWHDLVAAVQRPPNGAAQQAPPSQAQQARPGPPPGQAPYSTTQQWAHVAPGIKVAMILDTPNDNFRHHGYLRPLFSERDLEFVGTITEKLRVWGRLTERQQAWLDDLFDRALAARVKGQS